jgi:L-ribulose-5-phosphate 4-epimerase
MLTELRREACEANRLLPALGLVDLNFGNASAIDRTRGIIAIKPSGVDYDQLRPSDMVLLDLDGIVVEGRLRPSSDTATHLALYRGFRGIGAVVHTHSRDATAFAQAGMPIRPFGTTHSDFFRGPVPVTRRLSRREIDGAYESETGKVILEAFERRKPLEIPAILVRGHGPFVWGETASSALENAAALELCAGLALRTLGLSPGQAALPKALLDRHFLRKHGKTAYYGQGRHS